MQKKMNEMENVKHGLRSQELTLEHMEMERLELVQKLHENYEELKFITKERNNLKELQESFDIEREKLKECIRELEITVSYTLFFHLLNVSLKLSQLEKGEAMLR